MAAYRAPAHRAPRSAPCLRARSRRSTALIRPAKCNAMRSSRARRTARSTAAWSGTSRNKICAAPINSAVSTRGACAGSPSSRKDPSRWRKVPSRRSTTATIARVSPRSRSESAASAAVAARASEPSSISSSARCRPSTPSTISAATRRTARPGESSRSPARGFFLRAFFAKNSSLREGHGYAKSEAMPTEPSKPARTRGPSER